MRVNLNINNNPKYSPSFGSMKLYQVGIKQMTGQDKYLLVPAVFSKLLSEDIPIMKKLYPKWGTTKYGKEIINSYMDKHIVRDSYYSFIPTNVAFYAVEQEGVTSKNNIIRALAKVLNFRNFVEVQYIQSESKVGSGNTIKGAGDVMMYGIVKHAKEMKKNVVFLVSTADDWYQKLGFKKVNCGLNSSCFELDVSKYDDFMKKIEEKYNFK